jgi:hypothetical protein
MQGEDGAHPEWDQLYAAGVPATRIAELAGAKVPTVKRHLERRRAQDPELAAKHHAAPRKPGRQWHRRLLELRDFIATHGRYPAIHGREAGEASLYGWLCAQRHALVTQTLGWERARELGELLGDWVTTDLEREQDTQWRQRLDDVAVFVAGQGRLPRHRPFTTKAESSLSIWLQTQNNHALHKRLAQWRLTALEEEVPGWRKPRSRQQGQETSTSAKPPTKPNLAAQDTFRSTGPVRPVPR